MMNRVSKKVVADVLKGYFTADMASRIYHEICKASEKEAESELGMTYGEWKSRFDDDVNAVWAADTVGGFGHAGDTCYGDCDDCRIVRISTDGNHKTLYLWSDIFGDLNHARKPWLIKFRSGLEYRANCESLGDAIEWGKNQNAGKFECFRWEGISEGGRDMWVLAFRIGKED